MCNSNLRGRIGHVSDTASSVTYKRANFAKYCRMQQFRAMNGLQRQRLPV